MGMHLFEWCIFIEIGAFKRSYAVSLLICVCSQAICMEAGLMALRERRMKVTSEDFRKAKESILYRKNEGTPEGLYL